MDNVHTGAGKFGESAVNTDDYYSNVKERTLESYDKLRQSLGDTSGSGRTPAGDSQKKEGASDSLRKMLQSHGIEVSSADQMMLPSNSQASTSDAVSGQKSGEPVVVFTSTPTDLEAAKLDKIRRTRADDKEIVTKNYLDEVVNRLNESIREIQLNNSTHNPEKTAAGLDGRSADEMRGRSTVRNSSTPFRQPQRSHSPANAASMHAPQRRSQSAEPKGPSVVGSRFQRPPPGGGMNVSVMSDAEVVRQSLDRGLLSNMLNNKDATALMHRLQSEINYVRSLYEAKTARYEEQVEFLQQQLALKQPSAVTDPHSGRPHPRMTGEGREPSLCIKCGKHEAVMGNTLANSHMAKIQQLTKEVGDLKDRNEQLRERCTAMHQREMESFSQVRGAVQLVEQAQMERTQAVLEAQQSREELARRERQLQTAQVEAKQRVNAEREAVRAEVNKHILTLQNKVDELVECEASLQVSLEKSERDKLQLRKELEKARRDVEDSYLNVNKVSDGLKGEIAAAIVERDDAKQMLENVRRQHKEQSRHDQQEMNLLRSEIDELRRRLSVSESGEKDLKEQVLNLTQYVGTLEKEAFESKRARDQMDSQLRSVNQKCKDKLDSMKVVMNQQKHKFELVSKDMDDLMCSQSALIGKLKNECKFLLDQLQTLSFKYQSDVEQLHSANGELAESLKRRQKQVKHFEREAIKHGRLQHRMKTQLNKMATASHHAQNEVAHLAVKHNHLLKQRDQMASELNFFRFETLGALDGAADIGNTTKAAHHLSAIDPLTLLQYPDLLNPQTDKEREFIEKHAEEIVLETERQIADNILTGEEKTQK